MSRWADLTTAELGALDRGVPVVLPIGAIEQHGPHLPLSTDQVIADHLARELDAALGDDVLILPTAAVGCSDHHDDFPGTLSLEHDTLARHIENVATSVLRHGFRTFVLLNAHGGNQGIGQVAIERLGAAHRDARVVFTSWWRVAGPELREISETGPGGVGHACELETSIMLAIAPDQVRTHLIPDRVNVPAISFDDSDMLRASRATLYRRSADIAPTGVFGEPKAATADKGRRAVRAINESLAGLVRELR
ncbi:MAG TPA: creatininase family protein [Actinokineospora sp.]|jgi:creatinine amidohydrolase|nr:creatininase family protein [Actinokineospora sp.]